MDSGTWIYPDLYDFVRAAIVYQNSSVMLFQMLVSLLKQVGIIAAPLTF